MSDEEVIKRRLLIDGDGTGDDRRLNMLLKAWIKFCNGKDESPEEIKLASDRILAQATLCEFAVEKSRLSSAMSSAELKNYENLTNEIEAGIETAKKTIERTKQQLQEAKTVRKNRMEYDVMAKVINEQPDRKATTERLKQLREELNALETTRQQLGKEMDMRRKQFHVLITSIHQLEAMLDNKTDKTTMDVVYDVDDDDDIQITGHSVPTVIIE